MGFFGRSTAGDIPGRPRDPSCSRADVRLQLLVFSGPGLQKTRASGIEDPMLRLREERLLVCGEADS